MVRVFCTLQVICKRDWEAGTWTRVTGDLKCMECIDGRFHFASTASGMVLVMFEIPCGFFAKAHNKIYLKLRRLLRTLFTLFTMILISLQRSYPSEYKKYRRHGFITISIERSTSRPESAPQSQEPQLAAAPSWDNVLLRNVAAPETPTQGNSDQLGTLSLFYRAFLQLFVHFRVISRLLLLRRLFSLSSPFTSFGIYLFCTFS